jgi:hypothetical protein
MQSPSYCRPVPLAGSTPGQQYRQWWSHKSSFSPFGHEGCNKAAVFTAHFRGDGENIQHFGRSILD